jgi:hypothetical protein
MSLAQKWLSGLIGLGALYLVGTKARGLSTFLGASQRFISRTEATAIGR